MNRTYGTIICRVQPFHDAHQKIFTQALELVDTLVVILGSSDAARSLYNPWTPHEREEMVLSCFPDQRERIKFVHAVDHPYDNQAWLKHINQLVDKITDHSSAITFFGHRKDHTSDYLNWFPKWGNLHEFPSILEGLSATQIRENYFSHKDSWRKNLPNSTIHFLEKWQNTTYFVDICHELDYYQTQRKPLLNLSKKLNQPITFSYLSICLTSHSQLLLERRTTTPGKGLWCLPEIPIHTSTPLKRVFIPYLMEDLKVRFINPNLLLHQVDQLHSPKMFDNPRNSQQGRTIKYIWQIKLDKQNLTPASTESDRSKWFKNSDLPPPQEWYADYFRIFENLSKKK